MGRKLRYGMVGGGPGSFIGDAHRKAISIDGEASLCAGAFSRSYEKSLETAQQLGIPEDRCYASYQEMAEKEATREDGIDFVVVVTPNSSHFEICKAFLNAGIHVACDKPVTISLAQAKELEELAERKGLLFMVTYTYMGHVTAKYARDLIRSGAIGEVRTVMAEYPQVKNLLLVTSDYHMQMAWLLFSEEAYLYECAYGVAPYVLAGNAAVHIPDATDEYNGTSKQAQYLWTLADPQY